MEKSEIERLLRLAYGRIYDAPATSDDERDLILRAMAEHMPAGEAEIAARLLHHRQEQRKYQLTLDTLVDPAAPPPPASPSAN